MLLDTEFFFQNFFLIQYINNPVKITSLVKKGVEKNSRVDIF